ncbi:maltoporin LamB [Endozoicomonadaceae bacterium StTr2]
MSRKPFIPKPLCYLCSTLLLASASTTSMATITGEDLKFTGYARSGIGNSNEGGKQQAFKAVGAPTKYRLGNETETFVELGLGGEAFNDGTASWEFKSLVAYSVDQATDWEATKPALREFYMRGTGVFGFAPEASIWAGKRYYKRHDIHMIDYYYLTMQGPGAGIENIDLGGAKFSAAWMRNTQTYKYYSTASDAAELKDPKERDISYDVIDLRLEDIELNQNGKLTAALQWGTGNVSDGIKDSWINTYGVKQSSKIANPKVEQKNYKKKDLEDDGFLFSLIHTQSDFLGGFNQLILQHAKDAGSAWGFGTSGLGYASLDALETDKLTRVMDTGVVALGENVELNYVVGWSKLGYLKKTGKKDQTWITAGMRPVYFWNNYMSTALDVGYDMVKDSIITETATDGKPKTFADSKLTKVTLAQQWSAGRSYWARPQIRLFATYAKWNKESKGKIGGAPFDKETSGWTYGVQGEIWW